MLIWSRTAVLVKAAVLDYPLRHKAAGCTYERLSDEKPDLSDKKDWFSGANT